MATSKRRKKAPMTFDVLNSSGVPIPKARKPHWKSERSVLAPKIGPFR